MLCFIRIDKKNELMSVLLQSAEDSLFTLWKLQNVLLRTITNAADNLPTEIRVIQIQEEDKSEVEKNA